MPNLRGANPVGRDGGDPSYAARTGGKEKGGCRIGAVAGVWRDGMRHSRTGVASASKPRTGPRGVRSLAGRRSLVSPGADLMEGRPADYREGIRVSLMERRG